MKRFVIFLIFLVILLLSPRAIYAQEKFKTSISSLYDVSEDGKTHVTHEVLIENLTTDYYAGKFKLNIEGIDPVNPKAYENGSETSLTIDKKDNLTSLEIIFSDAVVGVGNKKSFSLVFEDSSLAAKTGDVWEISIPKIGNPDSFDSYAASLIVPKSFGIVAYISPEPIDSNTEGAKNVYFFEKDQLLKTGVTAAFGQFQVFSFDLTYHLENPLNRRGLIEIAIPPDTSFQRVFYEDIDPKPTFIKKDNDGNWLATYELGSRERVDVKARGQVQVFAKRREFERPGEQSLSDNLKETLYWQTSDPAIDDLANRLKTPRAIYDYVVNTLTYAYDKVDPRTKRIGASGVLLDPSYAICTEFTDLFIAIARAAGIPAREINGYAWTENPELQPLSLVSDVLHAWPEYWDHEAGAWTPIDPTWGNTTGGIDYFSKLDMRHIAFVIHGENAERPFPAGSYKLGPNPQKDVFVSISSLSINKINEAQVEVRPINTLPISNFRFQVTLYNPGPQALYNQTLSVSHDGEERESFYVDFLPPFSSWSGVVEAPVSFLGLKTPNTISIYYNKTHVDVPTNKVMVAILQASGILFLIFLLLLIILWKHSRSVKKK